MNEYDDTMMIMMNNATNYDDSYRTLKEALS